MKMPRKKVAKKTPVLVKKKKSFDFKSFSNSLNSLNKDNYGSAPLPVRLFLALMIMTFILALAWFLLVDKKREEIKQAEAEQVTLLETYQQQESKARHLDEYKAQVEEMQVNFRQLLNQLPKETQVSELIEGINMVGSGSGIRFQDITVEPEVEKEFFVEQPIRITAIGEYHQFGNFLTGIAGLSRIITMHDFEIKNPQPNLTVMPELQLVLGTKTYRSKTVEETPTESTDGSTADAGQEEGAK